MSLDFPIIFYFLLPIIALLYATVGHGGASGYLALMALFNAEIALMRPTALLLNVFVAGIAFVFYWRQGFFKWKLFYPFALASVPAAFIGGYLDVNPFFYKKFLGVLLLISVVRLLGWYGKEKDRIRVAGFGTSFFIGLLIGLFSGLIGIGGGIILSPLILLLHWANMKETAAVSALFIWINSLAGLTGMMTHGWVLSVDMIILVGIALTGGSVGAYLGSSKWDNDFLKKTLAFVLIIASIKLLIT